MDDIALETFSGPCPVSNALILKTKLVCRKCIYVKLSDEEVDCCPVCKIDLGVLPVEKLRPDHNLQDIRAKIFPYKRRKVRTPDIMPSIVLPAKRKERSLSSLVVSTPKVPIQTGLTGRRSKSGSRKFPALRGCDLTVEESSQKDDSAECHPMTSSSAESPNKITQTKRQDYAVAELYSQLHPNDDTEDGLDITEGKVDLWTPLNCLVEAANRTKSSKLNSHGLSLSKSDLPDMPDCEPHLPEVKPREQSPSGDRIGLYMPKIKKKEHGLDIRNQDHTTRTNTLPASVKRRRLTAARKRAAMSRDQGSSAQVLLDAAEAKNNRRNCPIWFSLVASEDQKGDTSLPQISACYLRIKDAKMPVSFIQKYLVKKLDLSSEAEVEIMCRGRPVLPTQQLHNLVELWFRTTSISKKIPASVGSSAKDFVMVLSYCRKIQAS